jgi:hypothetical protein
LLTLLTADFFWVTRSWDRTWADIFPLLQGERSPQEAACAQEGTALQAQAVQLKADMDVFNRECGGTRTKSEYAAKNCAQRGAALDQRNASLDAAVKSHNARCK